MRSGLAHGLDVGQTAGGISRSPAAHNWGTGMTGRNWRASVAAGILFVCTYPAAAQGLIWNLPADGTEVVYGGTLTQTDTRPGGEETTMTWDRQLTIRSVGAQEVEYEGEMVPGRWLEFELKTGRATEQGIDPGPVGTRTYRVLVAEQAISEKAADDRGIPNAFLPVIEGYFAVADRPVQKLNSTAFETYPTLTLLMNYKQNELSDEGTEAVTVPAGAYEAEKRTAAATVESPAAQVTNEATLYTSAEMPFGLVKWTASVSQSVKDPNQPRDAYEPTSRVESQMEAKAINQNAQGTLAVPGR